MQWWKFVVVTQILTPQHIIVQEVETIWRFIFNRLSCFWIIGYLPFLAIMANHGDGFFD